MATTLVWHFSLRPESEVKTRDPLYLTGPQPPVHAGLCYIFARRFPHDRLMVLHILGVQAEEANAGVVGLSSGSDLAGKAAQDRLDQRGAGQPLAAPPHQPSQLSF